MGRFSCLKVWLACARNTTHHGIGHAANAEALPARVLWMLLVFGSYSMFSLHLFSLIKRYSERPVSTSIQYNAVQFSFPDVTICNLTPLSLRYAEIRNLSIADVTSAEELRQLSESARQNRHDFIVSCTYDETNCAKEHDFLQIDEATYGHCVIFRPKNRSPRTTTPQAGLNMLLFTDNQHRHRLPKMKYVGDAGVLESSGVRIVVHEPGSHPHPCIRGFDVSTGTYAKVAIRQEELVLLPIGNSSAKAKCTRDSQAVTYCNPDFEYYRQNFSAVPEDCQVEQLQREIFKLCRCVSSRYEVPAKFCDMKRQVSHCSTRKELQCESGTVAHINTGFVDVMRSCVTQCKREYWPYRLSLSTWPSHISEDHVIGSVRAAYEEALKVNNFSSLDELATAKPEELEKFDLLSKNLVRLTVYPDSLSGNRVVEDEAYPLTSLLGEIGGILGLYLGCSVLTVFEIFSIFVGLFNLWAKHKRPSSPSSRPNEPLDENVAEPMVVCTQA